MLSPPEAARGEGFVFCAENEAGSECAQPTRVGYGRNQWYEGGGWHRPSPHSPRGTWSCPSVINGGTFLLVLVHFRTGLKEKLSYRQLHHKREYKNSIKH